VKPLDDVVSNDKNLTAPKRKVQKATNIKHQMVNRRKDNTIGFSMMF